MDYKKEFYELIKNKIDEIKDLKIPKKEKIELYSFVNSSIRRYERSIRRYERTKKLSLMNWINTIELKETQRGIEQELEEITYTTKEMLSNLEELVKKQAAHRKIRGIVKKQRANKNILSCPNLSRFFPNYNPFSKN